jgi:hypothetical protein
VAFKNKIDPEAARRSLEAWLPGHLSGVSEARVSDVVIPTSSGMSCETVLFDAEWREQGEPRRGRLVARVAPHPDDHTMSLFPSYALDLAVSGDGADRRSRAPG